MFVTLIEARKLMFVGSTVTGVKNTDHIRRRKWVKHKHSSVSVPRL